MATAVSTGMRITPTDHARVTLCPCISREARVTSACTKRTNVAVMSSSPSARKWTFSLAQPMPLRARTRLSRSLDVAPQGLLSTKDPRCVNKGSSVVWKWPCVLPMRCVQPFLLLCALRDCSFHPKLLPTQLGPILSISTNRLGFEATIGQLVERTVEMRNDGSTAMYFEWERTSVSTALGATAVVDAAKHFFAPCVKGCILPATTASLRFSFQP